MEKSILKSVLAVVIISFIAILLVCKTSYGSYLYAGVAGSNGIYQINLTDWSYDRILTAELSQVTGLAYNSSDDYLYAGVAGSNGIYQINLTDWSYGRILTAELGQVTALEYIPEPATLLLLDLGGLLLRKRDRA